MTRTGAVQARLRLEGDAARAAEPDALVAAARVQPAAFGALYERYVDRLYAYALHVTGEQAVAEDVVAATFRRALEHRPRDAWRGVPISRWLYRIAHNELVARGRRAPPVPLIAVDVPDDARGPEQEVLDGERRREVQTALATLPPAQREVLLLRYGHDLVDKEIAAIMGRPEGAVTHLAHRAHRRLRARLTKGGPAAYGDAGERWSSDRVVSRPTAAPMTRGA